MIYHGKKTHVSLLRFHHSIRISLHFCLESARANLCVWEELKEGSVKQFNINIYNFNVMLQDVKTSRILAGDFIILLNVLAPPLTWDWPMLVHKENREWNKESV